MPTEERTPTEVDRVAEAWVDALVELDPATATYIGRTDQDHRLPDYSPEGHAARIDAVRVALSALRDANPADDVDRITVADLGSQLELALESDAAELQLRDLNVIASPPQEIREVFDLMPVAEVEDWERIAERLGAVPTAI